ncbi:hypothetical protein [Streptomyces sp. NPDC021212]|uniref:hypothetical protein n=1 Tax=Streptomyces sp. NPDC021212 TaxID=3365118 RepID=UPI00378C591F
MPITNPPPRPTSPSLPQAASPRRRSLLLAGGSAGAAALLVGCSGDSDDGSRSSGSADDAALRARGVRDSAALLARYDATIDAHAGLAERLKPLRAETAAHMAAFGSKDPSASASATASRSPAAGGRRLPAVPADEKKALGALAQAERHTADSRTTALVGAPPELARLLASVAACGAAHVYLLTRSDPAS